MVKPKKYKLNYAFKDPNCQVDSQIEVKPHEETTYYECLHCHYRNDYKRKRIKI